MFVQNIILSRIVFLSSLIFLFGLSYVQVDDVYAFDPPAANLIGRYVAGTGITSSGDSPDLISQWDDQSGNGYNLTQGVSASQPYNMLDLAGNPVVRFPYAYPVHPTKFMANADLPINSQSSSVFVIRSDYLSAAESLVSYGTWSTVIGVFNTISVRSYLRVVGRGFTTIHPPINKTLTGGVLGPSNYIGYSISASSTDTSIGAVSLTGIKVGADKNGTGDFFSGDIYEVLIYNAAVSQATVDAVRAYAIAQYGIQSSFTKQVVMAGDSNTEGSILTDGENYPRQAHPPDWQAFNNGVGGASLYSTWYGYSLATSTDTIYNASLGRNVLLTMLGTNDVNSLGRSAADTFSYLNNFIGDRQAAGWEVWVMTIPPVGGTGSDAELRREAYNTLLVEPSNYTNVPTKIIDYRNDIRIGGSATVAAFSNGDNLHFNSNGAKVLAQYVYKALNGDVPKVSFSVSGNSSGLTNENVTLTLTPSGGNFLGEVLTPSDGGAGGTFTPATVTTTVGGTSATINYSRPTIGTSLITFTNNGILGNPSAFSFEVPDNIAPTVSMTAPADAATISGSSISLTADANDNVGVSGVQFKLDTNTNIGDEDTSSPFTATWDSTAVSDGSHTLLAVARDALNNYATSSVITINVNNTPPSSGGRCHNCSVNPKIPAGGFKFDINQNASTTSDRVVTLNFNAGSDIRKMAISMTGNFEDSSREDYKPIKEWDLCSKFNGSVKSLTCPDGTYEIYAKLYTYYGVSSKIISDSIILETQADTASTSDPLPVIDIPLATSTAIVSPVPEQSDQPVDPIFTFTEYLKYGQTDTDVKRLQTLLNQDPDTALGDSGAGSSGEETEFFGLKTFNSVKKFQEKYSSDILAGLGLKNGTGFVGKATLAKINDLISKNVSR